MANKKKTKLVEDQVVKEIRRSLGLPARKNNPKKGLIKEAYVTQAKKFSLSTEFLSQKTKTARQAVFEGHVEAFNSVAALLDAASRDDADKYS